MNSPRSPAPTQHVSLTPSSGLSSAGLSAYASASSSLRSAFSASRIIGLFWGFGAALTLGLALYMLTVACLARYSRRAKPRLAADAPV